MFKTIVIMENNKRSLKAYVRFDGTGRVVSGSLILRKQKPKVGKWVEVPAYECCNPTTTTTTTIPAPIFNFRMVSEDWKGSNATQGDFLNLLDYWGYNNITGFSDFTVTGNEVACNFTANEETFEPSITIGSFIPISEIYGIGNVPSLYKLSLITSGIKKFNPLGGLAITTTQILFDNNSLTLANYTDFEYWASNQPSFSNPCIVSFKDNEDSVIGTPLATALGTKNTLVGG